MDRHLHEDLHQQMKMNKEMFDGNKEYPTQWALNPSTYQGMSNDQVDWAALAQQWIKMKEVVVPPAPPPPCLSNNTSNNNYDNDERGEAPMDMDTKDDDIPPAPPAPNISGNENNWNQWSQWGQWNSTAPGGACWEWSGVPPPGVQIGPDGRPMGNPSIMSTTVPPAPNISGRSSFNIPPPGSTTTTTTATIPYNYNTQVDFNSGYWSGEQSHQMTSGHPPPFLKGIRHNNRPLHMRNDIIRRDDKEKTPDVDSSVVIDAAKRRQLPAWIREGLEKMERQKHKAVERERQEILRSQELEARKIAEEEARAVLNPSKSKFDSDSDKELEQDLDDRDNDDKKNNTGISPEIIVRPRRSRFRDAESPESRVTNNDSPTFLQPTVNSPVKRSRDEILQDVMLKVRRSLTEILLEVTNEEISNVCREVWSRARTKAPAGDTPVASLTNRAPIAQITRELGLGIYGDSNSDSEEEQEIQPADNNDSDFELKETLRRRQAAFKKTEEEIEARLAEDEENELRGNEEQTSKYDNHTSNDTIIKSSVDENTINNERENTSETSDVQTQRRQLNSDKLIRTHTPSRSIDTTTTTTTTTTSQSSTSSSSSSSSSTSSTESDNTDSSYNRNKKNRKRNKERSISRSRNKRSNKVYRSRSSSKKNHKKLINEKKRRSRSKSNSRSKSRKRSRSRSKRQSRERKRSRSRSRDRERRRSRSYGYSKRRPSRSRTRSRERRRSRSRSRGYRDGKKSSRRYKD